MKSPLGFSCFAPWLHATPRMRRKGAGKGLAQGHAVYLYYYMPLDSRATATNGIGSANRGRKGAQDACYSVRRAIDGFPCCHSVLFRSISCTVTCGMKDGRQKVSRRRASKEHQQKDGQRVSPSSTELAGACTSAFFCRELNSLGVKGVYFVRDWGMT